MAMNNIRDVSDHVFFLKTCSLQRSLLPGFDQLPEEVFVDILWLLPIKILMQCKCVSKAWYRLISYVCIPRICSTLPPIDGFLCRVEDFMNDGNIIMDYISFDDPDNLKVASPHPRMPKMGGTTGGFVGMYTTLLPFMPSSDCLLDVCRGLLLFVRRCLSTGSQYYVCNPTTKQCVRIPKASFDMKQDCYATLIFNPFESPHYKVVRFLGEILDIFSSDTGMWVIHKFLFKPVGVLNDVGERYMLPRSCYLDGALYRLSGLNHLICYNTMTTTLMVIDLPLKYETGPNRFIGVSKGQLYYANNDKSRILVWVLKESANLCDGSKNIWILKHTIGFSDLLIPIKFEDSIILSELQMDDRCKVYAIHPTTDIVYIGNSMSIFSHHLGSNEIHSICAMSYFRGRRFVSHGMYVFLYSTCYSALTQFSEADDYCNAGMGMLVT